MANPTTNYGFVLPTSSDLVTDLPADFDVALQGVDTRLKALQPGTTLGDLTYSSATANTNTRLGIGTTGQVLAVSGAGVPAWTTTADVTPLTTKGDLFTFTTVDARIGVGANGTVLTADSAEATGLKWATPTASTPSFVGCALVNDATQTISHNTQTALVFTSETIDTDGFHSNSTNTSRITIPTGKAGKYLFTLQINARVMSSLLGASLWKNGSIVTRSNMITESATATFQFSATTQVLDLAVADYIEGFIYQASGSNLTIGVNDLTLTATYLGA